METGLPVMERSEFFFGWRCGYRIGRDIGMSGGVSSGISFGLGSEQDALGLGRGGFEAVPALQFPARGRVRFPVAWMPNGVRLRCGFIDDATFVVAIGFAAVNDAALLERAAYVAS